MAKSRGFGIENANYMSRLDLYKQSLKSNRKSIYRAGVFAVRINKRIAYQREMASVGKRRTVD
jgi:hypothetical protein